MLVLPDWAQSAKAAEAASAAAAAAAARMRAAREQLITSIAKPKLREGGKGVRELRWLVRALSLML